MAIRAIKILKATVGLYSNRPELLEEERFHLFLTNFHTVREIPCREEFDGQVRVVDAPEVEPSISVGAGMVNAVGPFLEMENQCPDRRYSLFGNEGLLFRFILHLLEAKHDIFSAHACAMVDERRGRLFIVAGSAGAGKSCFILRGLELGLKVFSAEMSHFRLTPKGVEFFKGAMQDNVRMGNLRHHFPEAREMLGISVSEAGDEWGRKVTVDLSPFSFEEDKIEDPEVVLVFPRVEREVRRPSVAEMSPDEAVKALFDNITEKVGQPVLLYNRLPVRGWDTPETLKRRLEVVKAFLRRAGMRRVLRTFSGPKNCWEGIL